MILPSLYIAPASNMGRGVFTGEPIEKDTIIEISPVIVMTKDERKLRHQTLLHDYTFEGGEKSQLCSALRRYVAVYNHSYKSNCEYEMNFDEQVITIKAMRYIKAGEELFLNYNGDWNNAKKVWFDER